MIVIHNHTTSLAKAVAVRPTLLKVCIKVTDLRYYTRIFEIPKIPRFLRDLWNNR